MSIIESLRLMRQLIRIQRIARREGITSSTDALVWAIDNGYIHHDRISGKFVVYNPPRRPTPAERRSTLEALANARSPE